MRFLSLLKGSIVHSFKNTLEERYFTTPENIKGLAHLFFFFILK